MILGALEAGGTKMVCAVGDENGNIKEQISIPTIGPDETIPKIIGYFKEKNIEALGIGCFGPLDLKKTSKTYGYITNTPKLAWKNFDMAGTMKRELKVPVGFDTDVNGPLLGEVTWGRAKGKENVVYITIGTGIGMGVLSNGKLLHGMMHPEAGHIKMTRHPDDNFAGQCPTHGNCLEGLACGPAIEERWGKKGVELSGDRRVWELEAYYLAQAIYALILTLSPELIILGGGVMHQEILFDLIRKEVDKINNGYLLTDEMKNLDKYIVPASLNDNQGIMGALKLGLDASLE